MTHANTPDLRALVERLNPMERELLLGKCSGWGSWMWSAGQHMASLGLATLKDGSIAFDTPLAAEAIAYLKARSTLKDRGEGR